MIFIIIRENSKISFIKYFFEISNILEHKMTFIKHIIVIE
jgi:hypothetical protein